MSEEVEEVKFSQEVTDVLDAIVFILSKKVTLPKGKPLTWGVGYKKARQGLLQFKVSALPDFKYRLAVYEPIGINKSKLLFDPYEISLAQPVTEIVKDMQIVLESHYRMTKYKNPLVLVVDAQVRTQQIESHSAKA